MATARETLQTTVAIIALLMVCWFVLGDGPSATAESATHLAGQVVPFRASGGLVTAGNTSSARISIYLQGDSPDDALATAVAAAQTLIDKGFNDGEIDALRENDPAVGLNLGAQVSTLARVLWAGNKITSAYQSKAPATRAQLEDDAVYTKTLERVYTKMLEHGADDADEAATAKVRATKRDMPADWDPTETPYPLQSVSVPAVGFVTSDPSSWHDLTQLAWCMLKAGKCPSN